MQETNLYTITLPVMIKSLKSLSAILDKAEAHAATRATAYRPPEEQMKALLNDRLVFDQFALVKQIQVSTDHAKNCAGRLAQIEIPIFEDNEKTVSELKERLARAITFLESIKPEQVIGKEGIQIQIPYFPGKYLTGFEYATEYALPNFYFHVTTAYSILRKNGVEIGKTDFTGGLPLKDL